jgi:hypothetical protein
MTACTTLQPTRRTAAAALVLAASMLAVSTMTQPDVTGGAVQKLSAIDAGGGLAVLSAALFGLAQLPFALGLLAVGGLLRERSSRLARSGATLGVLGAFGHTLFAGVSFTYLVMATDPTRRAAYAHLVSDIESSPAMLVSLVGLGGTVLGLLLLAIGLFRSGVGPRWVGPVLWAFLVVEFVGTGLSSRAAYLSAALLVVAFVGLARTVLAEDEVDVPDPAAADRSAVTGGR